MKTVIINSAILIIALLLIAIKLFSQSPDIEWQKSLGGSKSEYARGIIQDTSTNYILAGESYSMDGDISDHHGASGNDAWITKLDVNGNVIWKKSYGGTSQDGFNDVKLDIGSGYIAAGYTNSPDGDVTGNHGNYDFWVVKVAPDGSIIWKKCFGGTGDERAQSVVPVSDGYILTGYSSSLDGDVTSNHGSSDFWVVKLNVNGDLVWEKSLGGTNYDEAQEVVQTSNGQFLIAGFSSSIDGDVTNHHGVAGSPDYWVVKLNANGTMVWQKSYGGTNDDYAYALQRVSDNEFVIAGVTGSFGGDVTGNHGGHDFWLTDIDGNGLLKWQKCYGGTKDDWAIDIEKTNENGFIICGYATSHDGDVRNHHDGNGATTSYEDFWVVKTNATGILKWENCFGGKDSETASSLCRTWDGGYAALGWSYSADGDVTGHHGTNVTSDFWIVKLRSATIETAKVGGSPFCPEALTEIYFQTSGTYHSGNIFTAELSDKKGKFDSPTPLGTVNFTYDDTGIIAIAMPSDPKAGTKYRIRVTSSNPLIAGTDNGANLELIACDKVNNLSASVSSASAIVTWAIAPCAVKYKVQYRKQGTSSWTTNYTVMNSYTISGLSNNTTYEYRVQTYCSASGSSKSGFTDIQTFTKNNRLASSSATSEEKMNIYPNPSSGKFTVYLKPGDEEKSEAILNVLNETGRIICSEKIPFANGVFEKEIQLEVAVEGMYLVKMVVNDRVYTQQIAISKL